MYDKLYMMLMFVLNKRHLQAKGAPSEHLGTAVAGDAVVLPRGVERQVTAVTATEIVACGESAAVATVVGEDQPRGTPSWIS